MSASVNIAIVEDNQEIRDGLAGLIGDVKGYACAHTFGSGEAALDVLCRSPVDVVLMDIELPGISGIETTSKLKARQPQTQVIMLTVYQDNERIFHSLAAGATGYVLKHTSPDDLLAAVDEVLQGGSPISGAIARRVVDYFREAQPVAAPNLDALSKREAQILQLVVQGLQFREIAERLHISKETVRTHTRHIYEKLQVRSRAQATALVAGTAPIKNHP